MTVAPRTGWREEAQSPFSSGPEAQKEGVGEAGSREGGGRWDQRGVQSSGAPWQAESFQARDRTHVSALAGGLCITEPPGKPTAQSFGVHSHCVAVIHVYLSH